jgi:hypothetical protein
MCETRFKIEFIIDTMYKGKQITLKANRKGMTLIPPIGMHITFGKHSVEIIEISAPYVFNVVTCKCKLYKPLTEKLFNELKSHGITVENTKTPPVDSSGNMMVKCHRCKGTGTSLFTHEAVQTWDMKPCPDCAGVGFVPPDPCEKKNFKNGVFIGE